MKTYKILDWKKVREKDLKSIKKWKEFEAGVPNRLIRQQLAIRESIKLPKVKSNESVLVFAGSTGEISSKIKGPKVIHTDVDAKRVKLAGKRYRKSYYGLAVADALNLPTKKVDWLFSFEPSPILNRAYFIPRAILSSKKGFIISRRAGFFTFRNLKRLAEMYGIKPKESFQRIRGADVFGGKRLGKMQEKKIGFIVFESNPRAKRLAKIDNEIIEKLSNIPPSKRQEAVERLRKELGISRKEMRESLERISELVSLKVPGVSVKGLFPKHLELPHVEVKY